jgi:hypothetical protein
VADGERLALRQEMWITRDAFLRSLPGAVGHDPFEIRGDEIVHREGTRRWRIRLSRLPDRSIGLLAFPRHDVEIHLAGFDDAAMRAFVERFELYYRRGGG